MRLIAPYCALLHLIALIAPPPVSARSGWAWQRDVRGHARSAAAGQALRLIAPYSILLRLIAPYCVLMRLLHLVASCCGVVPNRRVQRRRPAMMQLRNGRCPSYCVLLRLLRLIASYCECWRLIAP